MTLKELFEFRLEEATRNYQEAIKGRNRYNAREWLKRIKWCDEQLANLGES